MKLHDSLHNSVTTVPLVRLTTMSSPATRTVHFLLYIYFVIFCSIQIGQIHSEILGYATLSWLLKLSNSEKCREYSLKQSIQWGFLMQVLQFTLISNLNFANSEPTENQSSVFWTRIDWNIFTPASFYTKVSKQQIPITAKLIWFVEFNDRPPQSSFIILSREIIDWTLALPQYQFLHRDPISIRNILACFRLTLSEVDFFNRDCVRFGVLSNCFSNVRTPQVTQL